MRVLGCHSCHKHNVSDDIHVMGLVLEFSHSISRVLDNKL